MRATTAFNRIIDIEGVAVSGVTFTPEGVVVRIRRRKRLHQCPCGWTTGSHYDRSIRRWRHLDFGVTKCFLEAEICRIDVSEVPTSAHRGRALGSTRCTPHDRRSVRSLRGSPSASTRRPSPNCCA